MSPVSPGQATAQGGGPAAGPSARVLDLFAVPQEFRPIPGGRGGSVVAGDLVLSPGRDVSTSRWLDARLARLAVGLDGVRRRSLRVAVPVPARDGSWVVDGWGASRFEPDTTACQDLSVLVAAGRLLHAHLRNAFPQRPPVDDRADRWAVADRLAFSDASALAAAVPASDSRHRLVRGVAARLDPSWDEPQQLVHGDLAGNVLLDAAGVPVVIDLAPYWRPVAWAEAVCVLDAVLWLDADPRAFDPWGEDPGCQAMLRAIAFRVLSDGPHCDVSRYAAALVSLVH